MKKRQILLLSALLTTLSFSASSALVAYSALDQKSNSPQKQADATEQERTKISAEKKTKVQEKIRKDRLEREIMAGRGDHFAR